MTTCHFKVGDFVQFKMYEDDEWVNGYIDEVIYGEYSVIYKSSYWGSFTPSRIRKKKKDAIS